MRIDVRTAQPYSVTIEGGALDRVGEIARSVEKAGAKAMIVSETNVFPLYGERVKASLEKVGFSVYHFVFQAGETSKQISTV